MFARSTLGRVTLRRKASLTLSCEPAFVYDVLSDYANYSEWMPRLRSSRVIGHETNFALAEFEFDAQPEYKFTLECMHAPPQMVVSRSLSGHAMTLKLAWKITSPAPGEAEVTLTVEAPAAFLFLPGGYAAIMKPAATLRALQRQVSTFAPVLPQGEVLIEIAEGEDGLTCTYKGTKYKMEAAG